ncbi:rod shape-determining protein RodA [Pontibacter sp. G13]|uniref:rod shape-determining protein RodA n=1 Tax=Pontibacter sp. G13 TaxID=3074898 RepID=UPI00288A90AC|nr:rod shape-determining protein RodA [Pontibacter sp. G13]WNJ16713.1 rod shape-determining protein RodA [Pontibacter sp. G13]
MASTRKQADFDLITLALYGLLVVLGIMTVYAVTSSEGNEALFDFGRMHGKQLMWGGISVVATIMILSLDHRFIEASAYVAYGGSIGLLILTLLIGTEVNGAKAWLDLGGVRLQSAELAKIATALALAKYMSRLNFQMRDMQQFLVAGAIVVTPALITILMNDTGSALVFGSFIFVFYREGLNPLIPIFILTVAAISIISLAFEPLWVILGIWTIGALVFFFTWNRRYWVRNLVLHLILLGFFSGVSYGVDYVVDEVLQAHQRNRIMVLLDPQLDLNGVGYNANQSKIAIGSGGFSGKGFLEGNYTKNKFVPEQETDFIFCTIGEERGWLGSTFLVMVFFLIIARVQHMGESSKTKFARIYGYSVMSILFFHVMVNVGMTIGLMPVIGIPLPFISYGGSSLLSFTLLVMIMVNLHSYRNSVLGSKS